MNKIAIIYTTFKRNELAFKTIQSIQPYLNENIYLLIADQNLENERLTVNPNWHYTIKYNLPFDVGLSFARNYLVNSANSTGFNYCLLSADSLEFNQQITDLYPIIEFMESDNNIGIVGLQDQNRVKWTWNIELIPGEYFNLTKAKEKVKFKDLELTKCQVVTNFFLAKTQCLIDNIWDKNLKLLEHEDFFYRLSKTKWKVYSSDHYKCNYINEKPTEYNAMRDRMYYEFKAKLRKKYNITGWIKEER